MKKTILGSLLLLCVGSILFFSSFKTSTQSESLIVVQVYESPSGMIAIEPRIIISDGKTIRTVVLELSKGKNIESNLLKISTTLNEIKNEGYSITTSNNNTSIGSTTYVFEKK